MVFVHLKFIRNNVCGGMSNTFCSIFMNCRLSIGNCLTNECVELGWEAGNLIELF